MTGMMSNDPQSSLANGMVHWVYHITPIPGAIKHGQQENAPFSSVILRAISVHSSVGGRFPGPPGVP